MLMVSLMTSGACSDIPQTDQAQINQRAISPDDFPLTQGSNPTRIITERIFEEFTGESEIDTDAEKIKHSGTSEAYTDYLATNSKFEMIIAQQPDPEAEQALEGSLFKPIAKDALVFITNKNNPISDLSMKQIEQILTGKIDNWKAVGGNDEKINLFRRNEAGGSQILLDKYVLNGKAMTNTSDENIANDMREMSESVAKKISNGCTLGYTTYYFAMFSGRRNDVKVISIDGVEPISDTIKQNQYPLVSNIYIGAKKDNQYAVMIYDWIITKEGQKLIKNTGYIPLF